MLVPVKARNAHVDCALQCRKVLHASTLLYARFEMHFQTLLEFMPYTAIEKQQISESDGIVARSQDHATFCMMMLHSLLIGGNHAAVRVMWMVLVMHDAESW